MKLYLATFNLVQGVLEAVRISLAGYPTRRTYTEFVDRFGLLVPEFLNGRYYFLMSMLFFPLIAIEVWAAVFKIITMLM